MAPIYAVGYAAAVLIAELARKHRQKNKQVNTKYIDERIYEKR